MKCRNKNGFVAITAVIILASGVLFFSLVTLESVISFADSIDRKEIRIQTSLNAKACADTIALMAAKDYFISGIFEIKRLGCKAIISNDFNGNITGNIETKLGDIKINLTESFVFLN